MSIQGSVAPFESIETLTAAMADHGYFAGHGLAAAIFLSVRMSKPLLLEGEPGVGKTEVAKVLASLVGAPLIRLQCYEGIDVHQAIYQWDFARQMIHIRMLQSEHGIRDISRVIYGEEFLLKGPLLRALESTAEAPAVLLIDEIDRADDEFEALLLEALSDYQVSVPEIGTVSAAFPPIVVITSNRTREVHDALKRRCLYQWIDFPSAAAEQRIVMAKVPDASQLLVMKVTRFVQELRAVDLYKVPGIAETIDWARALVYLGCEDLTREAVQDSIGALLKYQEDMKWSRSKDFAQLMDLVTDA
jgi:MoxR-like ATPase